MSEAHELVWCLLILGGAIGVNMIVFYKVVDLIHDQQQKRENRQ